MDAARRPDADTATDDTLPSERARLISAAALASGHGTEDAEHFRQAVAAFARAHRAAGTLPERMLVAFKEVFAEVAGHQVTSARPTMDEGPSYRPHRHQEAYERGVTLLIRTYFAEE